MPILGPASSAVTARGIIRDALSFHLNRLSPGEAEDADLFAMCLRALNAVADEMDGTKSFLFREILSESAAITGATAVLGTDWTDLLSGDEILGATVDNSGDRPLNVLTMEQYQGIVDKTQTGVPRCIAHDGGDTVYLYPAATGQQITLRTKEAVGEFTDLDTEFIMPRGYRSGLAAMLAEKLAPTLNPGALDDAKREAKKARNRLAAQAVNPAIIGCAPRRFDIITGY